MAGSLALRWSLTAAFVLAGGYCTAQCLTALHTSRRPDGPAIIANVAHLSMSAVMIGMVWLTPSWHVVTWEMALFAVAGGWFAVRIVGIAQHAAACGTPESFAHGPVHSRLACAHHAAAMAAMVWMLTAMAARPGMPGMPAHAGAMPGSSVLTAAALGVYFAIAAALWLVGARRRRVAGSAAHALMSAAMGTTLLALAW